MEASEFPAGNPRLRIRRPDPQDRNAPSPERLTHAVICLLIERGAAILAEGLKPDDITRRAGKSRASYYRTEWLPSGADAGDARRVALEHTIRRVLDESAADVSVVVDGIAGYLAQGWVSASPREFVAQVTERNFEEMQHYTFSIQMLAASLASSSTTVEASLRDFYKRVTEAYTQSYTDILGFWGYRLKPPMTAEKFAVVLMGLAEGLVLRHLGDGGMDASTYSELLSTVAASLIVAEGDLAEPSTPPEHHLPGMVAPPSRAGIIATFHRLFESERATLPSTEELARAVGCSPETIRSQFGGVVGVVRAAWAEWTPEFEEVAARNRRLLREPDPLTVLHRVANAVANRAIVHRPITRALLMSEVGVEGTGETVRTEEIAAIFERLLREAGDRGDFRPPAIRSEGDSSDRFADFAKVLRDLVLSTAASQPVPNGVSSEQHAQQCVEYVWALLIPARRSFEQ